MDWPPKVGELLPRRREATGLRHKLSTYCLDLNHQVGGPKARAFEEILGISLVEIEYLETEIRAGILREPVRAIRTTAYGIHCVVDFPIRGLGKSKARVVTLRTVWSSTPESPPRLVSAYLKP